MVATTVGDSRDPAVPAQGRHDDDAGYLLRRRHRGLSAEVALTARWTPVIPGLAERYGRAGFEWEANASRRRRGGAIGTGAFSGRAGRWPNYVLRPRPIYGSKHNLRR